MKVMLVGGGSGGHIFPLIAVQQELARRGKKIKFIVVSDKMNSESKAQFSNSTKFYRISSGKIRRFAHWKWYQYFYPTRYKFYFWNVIDVFKTVHALLKSRRILSKEKPDVIFSKGGFISVPIGLAARGKDIPLVLHESDTRPGLAGRLLKKDAVYTALGMPVSSSKSDHKYTGIPVRSSFFTTTKSAARKRLKLDKIKKPILLITGGSLGARRINQIVADNLYKLVERFYIIHISGAGEYQAVSSRTKSLSKSSYKLVKFVGKEYVDMIAAADLVVARAGATSIAELAAAAKPVVFVPNSYLTDQVSNAQWLERNDVGIVADETELNQRSELLLAKIDKLAGKQAQKKFSKSISEIARPNAAKDVADLIVKASLNR